MKRTLGAALVGIVAIGCESGQPRLGLLPAGDPPEVEPGYVSLRPPSKWRNHMLPRCGAIGPRTSTSPAIEILSTSPWGNVQIWEDGRVLFDGPGCPNGSGRRGQLSPARVRAVIDLLAANFFFLWPCDDEIPCYDSYITSLTVQRGGARNTVVDAGCDSGATLAAQAIQLVMQAVGNNACDPS